MSNLVFIAEGQSQKELVCWAGKASCMAEPMLQEKGEAMIQRLIPSTSDAKWKAKASLLDATK